MFKSFSLNFTPTIKTSYQLTVPILLLIFLFNSSPVMSTEYHLSGLVDLRVSTSQSENSYLKGGYGKFRYSDGSKLSLAQLAFDFKIDWENNYSFNLVTNAYGDGENDGVGIIEAHFKYLDIPNIKGYRFQYRAGFMYPKISLENNATGWSSPYTLSYSTMNTWIGEEVRHLGIDASMTRLGKLTGHQYDFSLAAAIFRANDTNGSLLSWHGWTQSSRQSFWNELLPFPHFPALYPGEALENQAHLSDPFKEVDSRLGYHLNAQWNWRKKGQLLIGYYDNRGGTDFVDEGQYSWTTRFTHLAIKKSVSKDFTLLLQYMTGFSRMRVVDNFDVVDIDFENVFLLLSKKMSVGLLSARLEYFSTDDNDNIWGDNNDENGNAFTLSYRYPLAKNTFINFEYNRIDSNRPSRTYAQIDKALIESQWQIGFRYFFNAF